MVLGASDRSGQRAERDPVGWCHLARSPLGGSRSVRPGRVADVLDVRLLRFFGPLVGVSPFRLRNSRSITSAPSCRTGRSSWRYPVSATWLLAHRYAERPHLRPPSPSLNELGARAERRLHARLPRLPEIATKTRARLTRLNPRRAHAGGPARADDQSLPQCRARYCGAGKMLRALPRRRGWRRCLPHQEHMSMTTDSPQPGETRNSGRPGRLRVRADGRAQHSAVFTSTGVVYGVACPAVTDPSWLGVSA